MSDCLQNEDSIVSDLSSSNTDSLTGTLDSGDNVNSDISIDDAMASSISDADSTDSNLGDDGSLYSELSSGGGGGAKYTGQETDSIVVTVDNNVYTISASLKPIKFNSVADFPETGSEKLIYVDFSNKTLYGWDSTKGVYYKLVADVKVPTKLSEFANDTDFITKTETKEQIKLNTPNFLGNIGSLDDLEYFEPTENDFVFLQWFDGNNQIFSCYKYSNGDWTREYDLPANEFTQNQWMTINSGVTYDSWQLLLLDVNELKENESGTKIIWEVWE